MHSDHGKGDAKGVWSLPIDEGGYTPNIPLPMLVLLVTKVMS